jgi:hypothetical protein
VLSEIKSGTMIRVRRSADHRHAQALASPIHQETHLDVAARCRIDDPKAQRLERSVETPGGQIGRPIRHAVEMAFIGAGRRVPTHPGLDLAQEWATASRCELDSELAGSQTEPEKSRPTDAIGGERRALHRAELGMPRVDLPAGVDARAPANDCDERSSHVVLRRVLGEGRGMLTS